MIIKLVNNKLNQPNTTVRENVEREGVGREDGDSDWRVVEGNKPHYILLLH
jgi:hypothetical protein